MKTLEGGGGSIAPPFLTSALDGGKWRASCPWVFTPGERALCNQCIGGLVDPRAGLDVIEKRKISFLCPELNPESSATPVRNLLTITKIDRIKEQKFSNM
jgi:hypothetical protein